MNHSTPGLPVHHQLPELTYFLSKFHWLCRCGIHGYEGLTVLLKKIMASGPKTTWQRDEETMETVRGFIFGLQITVDDDSSHKIKRHLLLRRKVMTNLDRILKTRDITLPTKVHLVKAMAFSSSHIWMWELDHKEGWTLKNWCFWFLS